MADAGDSPETSDDEPPLPERAAALVELLSRNAATAEQDRALPDENVRALQEAGLFGLLAPARFGGHQTDFRTFVRVIAELGRGCGSTAWVVTLINTCQWMVGLLPERAQQEVFGVDPDARVCTVIEPNASSTAAEGGQVITGRWAFASGCGHCQWAMLGIPIVDDAGEQVDQGLALVPMEELEVVDTWFVSGMRGTGSNTLVGEEIFVPEHRILSVSRALRGDYPTEHDDEVLYRSAFAPVLIIILAAPLLGLARGGLDAVLEGLGKDKKIAYTFYADSRHAPSTQMQLAEAAQLIDTAELHLTRAATDIDTWAAGPEYMPEFHRARVRMDTGSIAVRTREALDLLLNIGGAGSFAEANPLQRIWRDQEVAGRHAVINPAIATEVYGRALLGIEDQVTPII
ncbi:flavin-dependent monooxygenase [Saccharopolyspora gloriosae]|uniref:Alkylation response protein AidB-like acyl-CoA dehydrogenase n=1 Tax=Saccharopolyspora gloriosae TaxID=455344 RepID=A0A840NAP7_9PSEU|nr:acyl-CoA dehydrogenase family protein [Saccharopolyspora gloriosae]MBB5069326.1 alkylation response protein AidB-like acyl-CoA dehydrogenase [Saccharopolyspora gloriosae]